MSKTYRLVPRGKFDYKRKFKIAKRIDRVTAEILIDALKKYYRSFIDGLKGKKVKVIEEKSEVQQKIDRNIKKTILIVAGVFFLTFVALVFIVVAFSSSKPEVKFASKFDVVFEHGGTACVTEAGIQKYTNYAFFNFITMQDNINATCNISYYSKTIQNKTYIIRMNLGRTQESNTFNDFSDEISRIASSRDTRLTEISFGTFTEKIDEFENSVLILAPGIIPEEVLFKIPDLVKKNNVLIYIGEDFETYSSKSSSKLVDKQTDKNWLLSYGYSSVRERPVPQNINMKRPRYSLRDTDVIKGSIYVWRAAANDTELDNNGAVVIFPQTLDIGWDSPDKAAEDVAGVLLNLEWAKPYVSFTKTIDLSNVNESFTEMSVSPSSVQTVGYGKAFFSSNGKDGNVYNKTIFLNVRKEANGRILEPEKTVLTGDKVVIKVIINESKLPSPSPILIFRALNSSFERTSFNEPYQGQSGSISITPNVAKDFEHRVTINLEGGDYILQATEGGTGYIFAESYFHIPKVTVQTISQITGSTASFKITKDGSSLDSEDLMYLKIQMGNTTLEYKKDQDTESGIRFTDSKGKDNKTYAYYTIQNGLMVVAPPSQLIPSSGKNLNITFSIAGTTLTQEVAYVEQDPMKNPWVLLMLVLAFIFILVGYFFVTREQVYYFLDVPDFLPMKKNKIEIARPLVLMLFDYINEEYRWKYMPLTATELKQGFNKLSHEGKPLSITEFNLVKLLDQLIEEGFVWKDLGLYGLVKWEKEGGRDRKYLATFRVLRTLFLNNIIPFSELNEREDCDIVINVRGVTLYLHFFIGESPDAIPELLMRILKNLKRGTNIIIVRDANSLRKFKKELEQLSIKSASIVKIEINKGNALIVTLDKILNLLT